VEEIRKAADSWREQFPIKTRMTTGMLIPSLLALSMCAIALGLWRVAAKLKLQLRALGEDCRKAESENAQLRRSISARESGENNRIARLEHDLKSPLGVILGFSTLLGEFAHGQSEQLPSLPLRCISGIDQASRKMLQIIDAAARESESESDRERSASEGAVAEGKAT
jgi:signal transduction histidine kinase